MATSSFARPDGAFGRAAGAVMARLNADMETEAAVLAAEGAAVAVVDVLAIGFGPGVGIEALVARPGLRVHGIDPSKSMLSAARSRNRSAIDRGRVELRFGSAEAIPWDAGTFDAVTSVNNIQLWQPVDAGLTEVHRVLRPGGRFVVSVHTWAWKQGLDALVAVVESAGFVIERQWESEARSGAALHLVASRLPGLA